MLRHSLRYWCFQLISLCSIPVIVFALPYLMSMSTTPLNLYESWPVNPQQQAQLTQEYGFDQPLLTQSVRWLHKLVTGHWGHSRSYNRPVFDETHKALKLTLIFLLWAACAYSLWAGVLLVLRRLWFRLGFPWQCATLVPWLQAVPAFLLVILLRYVLLRHFGWIGPSQGLVSDQYYMFNPLYMFLPASMLVLPHVFLWTAQRRPPSLASARQPGVRLVHALADNLRHLSPHLGIVLMEVCLTEDILSFPGLGRLGIEALRRRDLPMLQGFMLCTAGLYWALRLLCSSSPPATQPAAPGVPAAAPPTVHFGKSALPSHGVWCSLMLIVLAWGGTHLTPHDPMEIHGRDQFQLPGYRYILGTDFLGRDVLSRTIKGFGSSIPRVIGLTLVAGSLSWCCARLTSWLPRPLQALWHGGQMLLLTPLPPFLLAFVAFLVAAEHTAWALESALLVAGLPLARQTFLGPMPWQIRLGQVGRIGGSLLLLEVMFSFLNLRSESFMPTWGSDLRYGMQYGHMNIWMLLAPSCAIVWSRTLFHCIGTTALAPPVLLAPRLTTVAQTHEPAER